MGHPDAFTMLELLVAMTLMVVAASACIRLIHGLRARRAQAAVEPTAAAINAIELVKQDICGVLPPPAAGGFVGTDSAGIKGVEADSMSFCDPHLRRREQPAEN
jgi:prepilin-type N-terminal cleavage/methylation domain-containing protein